MEYFTDFEEIDAGPVEPAKKKVRTEPWTLEEFSDTFKSFGLVQDGNDYVLSKNVQTSRIIVNGQERTMNSEIRLSFSPDSDFTGDIDGTVVPGIKVVLKQDGKELLYELIYCTPEDFGSFYSMYANNI